MKKLLSTLTAATLISLGATAQYFGTPFYVEGFDTQDAINGWTIENTIAPTAESASWHLNTLENLGGNYNGVVESSTGSLCFEIKQGDKIQTTITSPVINTGGRDGLVVGFSGYNLRFIYSTQGITVYFEVKATDHAEWTEVYRTNATGESLAVWGWTGISMNLGAEFDGKDLQLRFRVEAAEYTGYGVTTAFDGVYLSQKPSVDAQAIAITPSEVQKAFGAEEPISITIKNGGRNVLANFSAHYQINDGEIVTESVATPIAPNAELTYDFKAKADLSTAGKTYSLKAWITAEGDENISNDAIMTEVANSITSVPYKPTFWTGSRTAEDNWTALSDDPTGRYWSVGRNTDRTAGIWSVNSSTKGDLNTYLISRPIYFEEGTAYGLSFEAFMGSATVAGALDVYYTKDETAGTGMNLIYSNNMLGVDITKVTCSFTPAESGAGYLVFVARTPAASAVRLTLQNIAVTEVAAYDASIVAITAPVSAKYEYTNGEEVKVMIHNNGLNPTDGLKVTLYVDGRPVATESVMAIPSGNDYEYTFLTKADLSQGSKGHTIKVAITWDKDEDATNNEAVLTVASDVVSPPYNIDTYANDFSTYWTMVDGNHDGLTVAIINVFGNDQLEYSASDDNIAASTDEYLYSRPIRLYAGKKYRISPRIIVQGENEESPNFYHIAIGLYTKTADNTFELAKAIHEQDYHYWGTYDYTVAIDKEDIYYVGFHITKESESNYYFRLNEFGIAETNDNDIAIDAVYIPGTQLSAYNTLPLGLNVYNNGINPIESFKIKVSSATLGSREETITLATPLESQKYAKVYMKEDITFNNTETEELTIEALLEGDNVYSNNVKYYNIERTTSLEVPVEIPFDKENRGWLALDRDQDGQGFAYYRWYEGYNVDLTPDPRNDQLISRSIKMAADKTYQVSFTFKANDFSRNDEVLEVFAINCATLEKTRISVLSCEKGYYSYAGDKYIGYVSVPANGEYSILFEALPNLSKNAYESIVVGGTLSVSEVATKPDIELTAITTPAEDGVLTETETVTVTYKNAGSFSFANLPFTLNVGDTAYYATIHETIAAGAEGSVSFSNVNLNEPSDYVLTVRAESYADATIENNVISKTIKSLPIVELELVSIDSPKSGELGREELVAITIKNNGKGVASQIPVSYAVKDINEADAQSIIVNEVIEDSIAAGETMQYTFSTPVDFSHETSYSISVTVNKEGDTNIDNNTISTSIACSHKDMDAGVAAIVGPTDKLMTAEEYLVITVQNYGENVLYDVPVNATIMKDEMEVAALTGLVPEINAGESVDYTFAIPVNLSEGGVFTVTASTVLERDVNKENDTIQGSIYGLMIDCGIDSIISPVNGCIAGELEITVVIKNYGDIDVTDVPVRFKTGTMPQTGQYKGTIAAGSSVEYTFGTKYNFREGRTYNLSVWTEYAEDMNASNDTCMAEINAVSGVNGIYADGNAHIYANRSGIVIDTDKADGTVMVYTTTGVLVAEESITTTQTTVSVKPDVYVVKVETPEGISVRKVLVK